MQYYQEQIESLDNPSFQEIRSISNDSISDLSTEERNDLWRKLNRGIDLLDSHELMCQYLHSYGNMHEAKIHKALKGIAEIEGFNGEFDIVDWGCGQGIACMCFFDYLKENNINSTVNSISLIEPSSMALERAALHINAYTKGSAKIKTISKFLNEVSIDDIQTEGIRPVIHFFSNILDIKEIDLKKLANKLDESVLNDNIIICVGPLNQGNRRIDAFYNYFDVPIIYDIKDSQLAYGHSTCTCNIKAYRLESKEDGNLIPIVFYPSVQFKAAYELDVVNKMRKSLDKSEEPLHELNNILNSFNTSTPFDIGANIYDDIHPVLAVLNNIVTRGLPTKASPYVENEFSKAFGYTYLNELNGEISFKSNNNIEYRKVLNWLADSFNDSQRPDYSKIDQIQLQHILTPIAVARIQKTILEALMTDKLDIMQKKWKVLVEENDVPCAAIAFSDIEQIFNNLTSLSKDYRKLKFPKVELQVISPVEFSSSPLHQNIKVHTKATPLQLRTVFDLVIDISTIEHNEINTATFSKYKSNNNCYFNIRPVDLLKGERSLYTSSLIEYRNFVNKDAQGKYSNIDETASLLKYFMQLIFRKVDFRPGQLPILDRALQNNGVIGLLPTGGGKSLTYQLAAMLQPGITMIVDPLRSLMKDQYDGLINAGIDYCTYINSSISPKERVTRELQMESSQMLFVFLSPERLAIYKFRQRLKNMHNMNVYFSYGVIDEVHCVSEWGHDFRISYLHLGRNLYNYVKAKESNISLFGLTATASFDVLADVERELSGNGAFELDSDTIVRYENTNRLELQYRIEKINVEFQNDRFFDIQNRLDIGLPKAVNIADKWAFFDSKKSFLKDYLTIVPNYINELQSPKAINTIKKAFAERQDIYETIDNSLKIKMPHDYFVSKVNYEQAGIVFCPHKSTTGVSVRRNKDSIKHLVPDVGTFVGGNDGGESMKNLELFRINKQPLMIATKAFGMGIDKPNVRFTINMNYSSSLESFVQEAGRAGRDGNMALSIILMSDYKLARINKSIPNGEFPLSIIKNKWFRPRDLEEIIQHYNLDIDEKKIDYCTPQQDMVKLHCPADNRMFAFGECNPDCANYSSCKLKTVPLEAKGWHYEKDLVLMLSEKDIVIDRKNLQYQNADYETVMYFYNNNFKGAIHEKRFMHKLLSVYPTEIFYGDDTEIKPESTNNMTGFLTSLMESDENQEIVSFVNYNEETETDIAKAIYRMTCIELIEDFTQDYANHRYRIVARKKSKGEYYKGLKHFLLRYYTEDRAENEIKKVPERIGDNEIHKSLSYLTEFVYEKISIKRKRAIDDMRTFCIFGVDETKDWKVRNEELKDFIYYYFNSKYAKEDYIADNGQPYSLTIDTDRGKVSDKEVLFKYLRVIEDDIVGPGTPIDNIRHLQGAVRLIRRSLTDKNPTLSLLNAFCLFFLGTRNNENLEKDLLDSYKEGMFEFESRFDNYQEFWDLFDKFNTQISGFADNSQLSVLKEETRLIIHGNSLKNIRDKYLL